MTTTVSQEAVEVTQADREAVAEFHRQSFKTLFTTTDADIDAGINRSYELLCQAFARHRQQAEREEEEAHKIGIDEGRQEMAREIDLATGGDGEFRYCMNGDPDRHCPDAEAMKVRVLDRFAALTIQRAFEERERKLREALKPFADCCDQIRDDEDDEEWAKFRLLVKDYRRARQALKETPDAH